MNEYTTPEHAELASAYVDGAVDDAQRAQVETSPDLMALAASFQLVRAVLADVAPSPVEAREQAVSAALAAFDAPSTATSSAIPVAPPTNVISLERHRRYRGVLSAAAAVLAVGVLGLVAVNGLRGSDSKSSSGTVVTADSPIAPTAGGKQGPDATIGSIGGPADARVAVDTPAQLLSVADQYAPVDTSSTGAAVVTTELGGTTASSTASGTAGAESANGRPAIACSLSRSQIVLAEITFRGVAAYAVRDTVTGTISAIDLTCHVLAEASP
jgi:negative regulator of sigma E activity